MGDGGGSGNSNSTGVGSKSTGNMAKAMVMAVVEMMLVEGTIMTTWYGGGDGINMATRVSATWWGRK